jgi:hypothetical protein
MKTMQSISIAITVFSIIKTLQQPIAFYTICREDGHTCTARDIAFNRGCRPLLKCVFHVVKGDT